MSSTQRIDDIINGILPEEPAPQESKAESLEAEEVPSADIESAEEKEEVKDSEKPEKAAKEDVEKPESVSKETDEYGIEVPKARTYSEEEVQRMIRDRLSRGRHEPQQQASHQAAAQQAAQDFQADPNSDQPWEQQLESFVKNTIDKVQREAQTKQYQREESERQTNFEVKFTTGMEKFTDFKDVVGKMPITDSMMLSIRDMENPATFIYAAAKLQPKELERIASLSDPFQQAKEMGRLDERMRKAKNISNTAVPLKTTKSDMIGKSDDKPKYSIDNLIDKHAKSRRR